jgi:hypothetical protein
VLQRLVVGLVTYTEKGKNITGSRLNNQVRRNDEVTILLTEI